MHGTACASAHRQPCSWINSLKSRCANFLYLIMMIPNYAKAVAMSFPRTTLNFVLLNHTHNLFWRCNSLHVKSMKYSFICLIVVRTMAHMDAVFFFNLAFSSTGGIKEKKGSLRAMLLNIGEAQTLLPWSTNEKNTVRQLFLKEQFSCFTYVYTYSVIINKNSTPFMIRNG